MFHGGELPDHYVVTAGRKAEKALKHVTGLTTAEMQGVTAGRKAEKALKQRCLGVVRGCVCGHSGSKSREGIETCTRPFSCIFDSRVTAGRKAEKALKHARFDRSSGH